MPRLRGKMGSGTALSGGLFRGWGRGEMASWTSGKELLLLLAGWFS